MEADSPTLPPRRLTETMFVVFLRIVALSCLWSGLQYWAMLVGYSHDGHARFDLLELPWRLAATALAVIFPVAAIGLWLAGPWGPVIWLMAAGTQVMMFAGWPEIFGGNFLALLLHAIVALVYITFRITLWSKAR